MCVVRDVTHQNQIEARDEMIRRDLERSAHYQRSVLGKPPAIDGLAFGIAYQPLDAVGGDVYDASLLPDGTLRLFIADATGHGIEAALATILIKKASGVQKGSARPNADKVGTLTRAQAEEIAKTKQPDLTAADLDAAVRTIAGSARSMGITVEGV